MLDTLEDPQTTTEPDGSHDNLPGVDVPSDEELKKMVYGGAPDTPANLQSYTAGGNSNPDPDLSKMESAGGDTGGTNNDSFYDNNLEQEPKSKIKSKFNGLGGKKKWAAFVLTAPSFVALTGVIVGLFLLLSGFQIGHVARVLKDFNYIFATRGARNFAKRGLLATINPNSKYKIVNEKSLSKIGLINKSNPEASIVKYGGKNSLSGRPEKLSIGGTTIDIPQGFGRNTPFRGAEREAFIKAVDDAILDHPKMGNLSSYTRNKAARAISDSVGIKLRSLEKANNFLQDARDWKKTVREFYENSQEKIDRAKAKINFSTNDARNAVAKTEEALKDPDILSNPSGAPGQESASRAVKEVLEESETAIAKTAKLASKVSVVEIVGWLCLFRDLKKVISDGSLQRMYGLARLSGQAFTAYDQFKTGDTSFAGLGLTANSYGNFATNVSYQQAMFANIGPNKASALSYDTKSLVDAGYDPIPEDFNIYQPLSVAKKLILALGSIGITKGGFNALLPGLSSALNVIDIDINKQLDKIDDGICNVLTTPEGIIGAVVVEIVIQIIIAVLTAGTGTAGSQAGEQAAKAGLVAAAKEVGSAFIGKLVFKQFRKELVERGTIRALRGTMWTFTKEVPKFLALTAGSITAAALLEKLAASGSGADLGGVGPDYNFFNKATLGANFLGNSYSQMSNYGRISTPDEVAEVREMQYEEVLLANKSKSLSERLLSINNPRSPVSSILGSIYLDKSSLNKAPQYVFNLPNLIFNPTYNNGLYSSILNTIKSPDSSSAFAEGSNNNDGYHVWFYSKDEEAKLIEDPSFDPDSNAEYVEANIKAFEERYGKCYKEDEAKMFTDDVQKSISNSQDLTSLILNNDSDSGFAYCSKVLKENDALHYRVYKADGVFKQYMEDVANATDQKTSAGTGPIQNTETFNTFETPCAEGTNDLGEAEGYRNKEKFKIRLCSIPGFTSTGTEDIDSGVNLVRVNSTISEDTLTLFNDMKAAGITPKAVSSFRSNEFQTTQYGDGSSGEVAEPGTSNHQMGYAIDFQIPDCNPGGKEDVGKNRSGCQDQPPNGTCVASWDNTTRTPMKRAGDTMWEWLNSNGSKYGFSQICFEAWHWEHEPVPTIISGGGGVAGGLGQCSTGDIITENQGKPLNSNLQIQNVPGSTIRVAKDFCKNVENMVNAAKATGLSLDGGGFRSYDKQVDLRKSNCGSSNYSIYEADPESCSPPTAKPGRSNHEKGYAIDFQNCDTHSTACYIWLSSNAGSFGFKNLPSEPWHWSVDGK